MQELAILVQQEDRMEDRMDDGREDGDATGEHYNGPAILDLACLS